MGKKKHTKESDNNASAESLTFNQFVFNVFEKIQDSISDDPEKLDWSIYLESQFSVWHLKSTVRAYLNSSDAITLENIKPLFATRHNIAKTKAGYETTRGTQANFVYTSCANIIVSKLDKTGQMHPNVLLQSDSNTASEKNDDQILLESVYDNLQSTDDLISFMMHLPLDYWGKFCDGFEPTKLVRILSGGQTEDFLKFYTMEFEARKDSKEELMFCFCQLQAYKFFRADPSQWQIGSIVGNVASKFGKFVETKTTKEGGVTEAQAGILEIIKQGGTLLTLAGNIVDEKHALHEFQNTLLDTGYLWNSRLCTMFNGMFKRNGINFNEVVKSQKALTVDSFENKQEIRKTM